MWHKTSANVGQGMAQGLTLYDVAGITYIDSANNSTYRELRDGSSTDNVVVGRVYHKLKIIVITDPELLTALSYKSNRNYTIPKPQLTLQSSPKYPLTYNDATGLCNSGSTYYVTYNLESGSEYSPNSSFGYPETMPGAYVSKVAGEYDANGNPTFLSINFPPTSFPFMRSDVNMDPTGSFSGTGWNANKIQIMVNEVANTSSLDYDTIPEYGWVKVSNVVGNGIYTGETGETSINPLQLQAYQFVISREDYESGTTYSLGTGFTENMDSGSNGLTFGDESFFFGSLKTGIAATSFKTSITIPVSNNGFNSSNNPTFDSDLDHNTYITEFGVFNAENELVGIAKPTYPLKKNNGKLLALKLEYDF